MDNANASKETKQPNIKDGRDVRKYRRGRGRGRGRGQSLSRGWRGRGFQGHPHIQWYGGQNVVNNYNTNYYTLDQHQQPPKLPPKNIPRYIYKTKNPVITDDKTTLNSSTTMGVVVNKDDEGGDSTTPIVVNTEDKGGE